MLKRIVGIVGWIGTGVVFVAAGVRLLQFTGALKPMWERQTYWMALAGLVLIAVYAVGQWREREAARHDPERHPQGVHRAEVLVLPA